MVILLKTALVRVSSIQIMQVRVQNKGKSVWKSRYDGDVSASPRNSIYGGGVGVREATGGPRGRGRALGGQARPHPRGETVGPLAFIFGRYFSYFLNSGSVKFQVIPRTFAPAHK